MVTLSDIFWLHNREMSRREALRCARLCGGMQNLGLLLSNGGYVRLSLRELAVGEVDLERVETGEMFRQTVELV